MPKIDPYTLAGLIYDQLHEYGLAETGSPLALNRMEKPWQFRSAETQAVWTEAARKALIGMGLEEGDPGPEGYICRMSRSSK